jgi:hypothetical protein
MTIMVLVMAAAMAVVLLLVVEQVSLDSDTINILQFLVRRSIGWLAVTPITNEQSINQCFASDSEPSKLMYSGGDWIYSRPRHSLSRLKISSLFLSISTQMMGQYLDYDQGRFLLHPFPFIFHQLSHNSAVYCLDTGSVAKSVPIRKFCQKK